MRNFPLYDLHWQDFEKLAILICEEILGTGTINFSTGPDGCRDGKFTGKAENFPSTTGPWEGKFIIQAKHTEKPIGKCSDSEFKTLLEKEIKSKLKDNGILTFDELLAILMGKIDVKVKEVFLPSLSFLFLLGKIQYHQQIDSFELTT